MNARHPVLRFFFTPRLFPDIDGGWDWNWGLDLEFVGGNERRLLLWCLFTIPSSSSLCFRFCTKRGYRPGSVNEKKEKDQ